MDELPATFGTAAVTYTPVTCCCRSALRKINKCLDVAQLGAEPALDIGLGQEVVGQIAADTRPAQARLAEGGRAVHHSVGAQRGNGLDITLRPGALPGVRPPAGSSLNVHASD